MISGRSGTQNGSSLKLTPCIDLTEIEPPKCGAHVLPVSPRPKVPMLSTDAPQTSEAPEKSTSGGRGGSTVEFGHLKCLGDVGIEIIPVVENCDNSPRFRNNKARINTYESPSGSVLNCEK